MFHNSINNISETDNCHFLRERADHETLANVVTDIENMYSYVKMNIKCKKLNIYISKEIQYITNFYRKKTSNFGVNRNCEI